MSTSITGPDPNTLYPIQGYDKLIFLKNFIKARNIFIGDYTYKVVKMRFDDKTIDRLQKIAWWDWDIKKINKYLKLICHLDVDQLEVASRE